MKQYRICEYRNGLGDAYWTVEHKTWIGWLTVDEFDLVAGRSYTKYFYKKKDAEKWVHEAINGGYKKVSCEEYHG